MENSTQKRRGGGGGGQAMWDGCKLQSVLKSLTVPYHAKHSSIQSIPILGACPHRKFLRFECLQIESESNFSGICDIQGRIRGGGALGAEAPPSLFLINILSMIMKFCLSIII